MFALLNDDCLIHICCFLALRDLISVSSASEKLNEIVRVVYRKFKYFDFSCLQRKADNEYEGLESVEVAKIIAEIGGNIEELCIQAVKFKTPNRKLLETVLSGCPNLQRLTIEGFILKKSIFLKFHSTFSQLQGIDIRNCALSNYFSEILQFSQTISDLKFYRNFKFRGNCLLHACHIQSLSLENCRDIEPQYFRIFCEQNRDLRVLNIQKCEWITRDNLQDIVENLAELEILKISNSSPKLQEQDVRLLAGLRFLKTLEIDFINFAPVDSLLLDLTRTKSITSLDISSGPTTNHTFSILSNFERLEIIKLNDKLDLSDENLSTVGENCQIRELHVTGCCNITNEGLLHFIQQRRNTLGLLDVSGCYGVTDLLLNESHAILEHRSDEVRFVVGGTQIDADNSREHRRPIVISFRNNYETSSMDVDYHICENPSDEKRFSRLMRMGLVIDDQIFSSESESDFDEFSNEM